MRRANIRFIPYNGFKTKSTYDDGWEAISNCNEFSPYIFDLMYF